QPATHPTPARGVLRKPDRTSRLNPARRPIRKLRARRAKTKKPKKKIRRRKIAGRACCAILSIRYQMKPSRTEDQSRLNPKSSALSIMIVSGEASGDKHGASLARSLEQLCPDTTFELFGAGGDEMRAAGVETL